MVHIRPFRALRPAAHLAHRVLTPAFGTLTFSQSAALAQDPLSFIHVTQPEIHGHPKEDPHTPEGDLLLRARLDHLISTGILSLDPNDHYYLYTQQLEGRRQVGLLAMVDLEQYLSGHIKRHESTREKKETRRTERLRTVQAHVGMVFLTYRHLSAIDDLCAGLQKHQEDWSHTTPDGITHQLYTLPNAVNTDLESQFAKISDLYIADGHHRIAAAAKFYQQHPEPAHRHVLAILVPDTQVELKGYHRLVSDLNGLTPDEFLIEVSKRRPVHLCERPPQPSPGTIGMYLGSRWFCIDSQTDSTDPVRSLDASVLQEEILAPILAIKDPRRSDRLRFIPGRNGPELLTEEIENGSGAVAFYLSPPPLEDLFAVADAGRTMPPKSTWFEPKPADGVVMSLLRPTGSENS